MVGPSKRSSSTIFNSLRVRPSEKSSAASAKGISVTGTPEAYRSARNCPAFS